MTRVIAMPMRPHNRGLRQAAGLAARLAPLACVCGLLATAPVRAEQAQAVGLDEAADERAAEQWLRFVERLNRYSALEPAGSHGSIGMALGAGAITQERPASALYPAQTMKGDDDDLEVFSPQSPLGEAINGKQKGDTVEYVAPNGKTLKVEIVDAVPYEG